MFAVVAIAAVAARAVILPAIWADLPFYRTVQPGWDQHRNGEWARHIAGGDWLCLKWPGGSPGAFWDAPLYAYLLGSYLTLRAERRRRGSRLFWKTNPSLRPSWRR